MVTKRVFRVEGKTSSLRVVLFLMVTKLAGAHGGTANRLRVVLFLMVTKHNLPVTGHIAV